MQTLVTANQRLATYLHRQYDREQAKSQETWPTWDCLPLSQWLLRMVEALPDPRLILNKHCELALWEKIIRNTTPAHSSLLRTQAAARQAMEAWQLLSSWGVPLSALNAHPSEDIRLFQQWAQTFQTCCQQHQWLDESSITPLLVQHLPEIQWPAHILLAGFIETPPQIATLLQQLAKHKKVTEHLTNVTNKTIGRLAFGHEEQECYAMAIWAKTEWQNNPNQHIGCVVPKLDSLRHKVARIFCEVFAISIAESQQGGMPFNLSGGDPLSQLPIIRLALSILQSVISPWPIEKISAILRSPFIGGSEQEFAPRILLDILLRKTAMHELTNEDVLRISQEQNECPLWLQQLKNFQHDSALIKNATLDVWAHHFRKLLDAWGWPGERVLNSAEYQAVERWQTLLNEFSSLALIYSEPLNITTALHQLQQLAEAILFQPESAEKPIQVLGMLEAIGMPFSSLWITGMHDQEFPAMAAPNPFIPLVIQQKLKMPHSSAEKEFLFSQQVVQRFCQSAAQVFFSYGKQKKDETYQVSPIIAAFPEISLPITLPHFMPSDTAEWEIFQEEAGPPLQPQEILRGGGNILKEQAACPFRAFAKIRLQANGLPSAVSGISLADRGSYLHKILERLWGTLENHANLCRYSPAELNHTVAAAITETLAQILQRPGGKLKSHFLKIEAQRLQPLILHWLDQEKARPPFHVKQREFQQTVIFAGLPLSLRIDRVDELANGAWVIIDYKTGSVRISDWFGDRPDDPQLPLYALVSPRPVHGLIFAMVRQDQCGFKGLSAADYGISGLLELRQQREEPMDNWQDFIEQRHLVLTQLAMQFQAGVANVSPKSTETTCQQCDLQTLCRIRP